MIPVYIKTPNYFDEASFITSLINNLNQKRTDLALFYLSDQMLSFDNVDSSKENFLFINWRVPDLFNFEKFIKKANVSKKSLILVIDESHKNLTEEAIRQFFIKTEPKIILKISPEPFASKFDEEVFVNSLKLGKTGCFYNI